MTKNIWIPQKYRVTAPLNRRVQSRSGSAVFIFKKNKRQCNAAKAFLGAQVYLGSQRDILTAALWSWHPAAWQPVLPPWWFRRPWILVVAPAFQCRLTWLGCSQQIYRRTVPPFPLQTALPTLGNNFQPVRRKKLRFLKSLFKTKYVKITAELRLFPGNLNEIWTHRFCRFWLCIFSAMSSYAAEM